MKVVLNCGNPGKVDEFRRLIPNWVQLEVVDLATPEESFTCEANASAKARAGYIATQRPCLGEDTGVFVNALSGRPGVFAKRAAGGRDVAEWVLDEMSGVDSRSCTMRTSVVLYTVAGPWLVTRDLPLVVLRYPRGSGGFGYDRVLALPRSGRSLAEMSPSQKDSISPRAACVRALFRR